MRRMLICWNISITEIPNHPSILPEVTTELSLKISSQRSASPESSGKSYSQFGLTRTVVESMFVQPWLDTAEENTWYWPGLSMCVKGLAWVLRASISEIPRITANRSVIDGTLIMECSSSSWQTSIPLKSTAGFSPIVTRRKSVDEHPWSVVATNVTSYTPGVVNTIEDWIGWTHSVSRSQR